MLKITKFATAYYIISRKIKLAYYKRLFRERTDQDVSTAVFQGNVQVLNRNVVIGKNVHFRGNCILDGDGPIIIGDNVCINEGTIIYASKGGGVSIGKNTGIAAYSYIIDMNHGTAAGDDYHSQPNVVGKIVIGENVWIAQNCTVLKGSTIGDNAVCAAKSVITGKNIPENAIVGGVPARIIKVKEKKVDE